MIWGGGSGKSGKKKTQRLLAQEKKNSTQQPRRKKNSTQQPGRKKKLNSTTWKKKKSQLNNLEEKKFIMDFMLGCDALNMEIHDFYILFRYK